MSTIVRSVTAAALIALACAQVGAAPRAKTQPQPGEEVEFKMIRTANLPANCVPEAYGRVTIENVGGVEEMKVRLYGLPPDTTFVLWVIQVPNGPFATGWYEGDMTTDSNGRARQRFLGRFNEETVVVAPTARSAPVVHNGQFADANVNPPTAPVHAFHLGLWFDSPEAAAKAHCPTAVTPFNGDHTAGVQVLNTGGFPDDQGPLRQIKP
jgi:hypothetical protein